jgi:hypothetical protein
MNKVELYYYKYLKYKFKYNKKLLLSEKNNNVTSKENLSYNLPVKSIIEQPMIKNIMTPKNHYEMTQFDRKDILLWFMKFN